MFAVCPDEIEVEERWYESDPTMRFKSLCPSTLRPETRIRQLVTSKSSRETHCRRTLIVPRRYSCVWKEGLRLPWGTSEARYRREIWHSFRPWSHTLYATGHRDGSGRWFLLSRHGRDRVRAAADA
jgi:hypothetical protein